MFTSKYLKKIFRNFLESPGNHRGGFTLLEVVITLGILVTIIFAVSNLMRSTFDVKIALSQKNKVTGSINRAIQKIHQDLNHAFLISSKETVRTDGMYRTVFEIKKGSKGDRLSMTYMGHRPTKANAKESDLSYVVYELKRSEKNPSRTDLYRGELARIPSKDYNFKDDPPMKLFVKNISNLEFRPWNGSDWSKSGWDSTGKETKDKLPHMVQVIISAWEEDVEEEEYEQESENFAYISTISYLTYAVNFDELKMRNSSFNWKL